MANNTIMHRWFEEVWNQRRDDTIDELLDEDAIAHGLDEDIVGPAAFRTFRERFLTAFPDLRITLEEAIVEGDMIAGRCSVTGTHTGTGLANPPEGKPMRFTGMVMLRVRDGKVVEGWNNFDFLSMYQQLGMKLT